MPLLLLLAAFLVLPAQAADWLYLTLPGDTLIGIGQQYLKNPRDWPKVQSANGVAIPRHLPVDTRIKIPVGLLKLTPAPVTVTAISGNVKYKPDDAGTYQKLNVGDRLTGGETVLSGPRSSVAYRFADGTTLTQQAFSKLSFGRLAAYGKTGMVSTELGLDGGRLEAQATPQLEPAGGFRVVTPVAVAGVRGTAFRLSMDEGKAMRNEVLEGAVKVAAQGHEVRVDAGYGTVAEQGKPPAPPRPLLPAPAGADLPGKVLRLPLAFSWPHVPGAAGYRAQLARDAGFAVIDLDDKTAGPAITWPDDLPDGPYYLRLRAIDEAGLEGRNLDHALELDARPFPPIPTAPAAGERLYGNDVQFAWAAAVGAQGYVLQVAPTPDFDKEVVERRLPAIVQQIETLPEGDWHWRAASLDEAGQAHLWSPEQAFRVQLLPGAPAGGTAKVESGQASFAWGASKGAARYAFELGKDANLGQAVLQRETDKTAITEKLEPGKYFWRVRGVEADGKAGAWSAASPVILPPGRPAGLSIKEEGNLLAVAWQGDAQRYVLDLAADAGFDKILSSQTVGEARASLQKPPPGRYWVRVKAVGEEGVESQPSEAATLEIKPWLPWWLLFFLPAL